MAGEGEEGCKIKGKKHPFLNSGPCPGYFLFPKPERVRGLKSCMRKNPCPPSVREFPEEPEERSHGDGASSPSTWKPRGIMAWLLSPSFCPSAASPRFCPEGGSLQVTPSRRNRCPQADDWDPCRTKPRGGTALEQYTRLVRCPHPPGSPSTIRSWGRLLTPSRLCTRSAHAQAREDHRL